MGPGPGCRIPATVEVVESFAGYPLVYQGELLGVLALFSRESLDAAQLGWLRTFAEHATIAIENARAREEVTRLTERLAEERDYLREEVKESRPFGEILGDSLVMQRVKNQIAMVARTEATVLVLGESGTGKELVARAVHEHSPRREGPLVRVNCASIPAELFESEFFGHVKGAFSGAIAERTGRFQLADGGTLFLDEVGEIPLGLQGKLLRVLQEGQFEKVGGDRTRQVNVRVVAATNRDLRAEAVSGRFRLDLYYRLGVLPVELPPLRERVEDIPQLAEHFLRQAALRLGQAAPRLRPEHIRMLQGYSWPGNIRELQNVLERAVILSEPGQFCLLQALPGGVGATAASASLRSGASTETILTMAELDALVKANLEVALAQTAGKVSGPGGAAELLGMHPSTLASRIRALGIEKPRRG